MTEPRTTPSRGASSPDDAAEPAAPTSFPTRAQANAARTAHSRAMRPWFRKKRFSLPSAVVVVFLIIMVSTGGNDPGIFDRTTGATETQAEIANSLPDARIGQSVRDGKFAFIVASLQKPGKTVTSRLGARETAQGVFVIVRVNVTNIGYDSRTLTATEQFLVSDKGQRFATSSAISALAGAETIFLEKIDPGHTVNDAPMLFDVPPGTRIASIELHDSLSSSGAKVKLS